jgi:hypothetical protein
MRVRVRSPRGLANHNTLLPQYILHCLPAVAGSALEVRGNLAHSNQFSLIANPFTAASVEGAALDAASASL